MGIRLSDGVDARAVSHLTGKMPGMTFLMHLYYPGSWSLIREKCAFVMERASRIIITACHDDVISEIELSDKITVLKVTNKGKDIGGKLASMSYYMQFCEKTDYLIFLHDKISPQSINAGYWFGQLYSIFNEENFVKVLRKLDRDRKTGVIGSKSFLKNEYIKSRKEFGTTNDGILRRLISDYGLCCKKYDFIAGTIFIARSGIFEQFFSVHSSLDAREKLEMGNVLDLAQGTYTHSWERLLCFIAEDRGYVIKGI